MTTDDNSRPLLTPDGNHASERCPICSRLNSPGACDHCQHFFGSYWDGEVIWSEGFDSFDTAWTDLVSLLCELQVREWDLQGVRDLAPTKPEHTEILTRAWEEESSSSALVDLIAFDAGPPIVTEGMLSGEGCSLYLDDFSRVGHMVAEISDLTRQLRKLQPAQKG